MGTRLAAPVHAGALPSSAASLRRAPARLRRVSRSRAVARTLLVDNYDSYSYNLCQIIGDASGVPPLVARNDEVTGAEVRAMVDGGLIHDVVLSPGPGSPHEPHDVGVCADLLSLLPDVPLLGVCLGLQCLAAEAGARVVRVPPAHGIRSAVHHTGHPLFEGIPSGDEFQVVRYHSLAVDADTLPLDKLEPLAWADADGVGSAGRVLMGLAHRCRPHYGVQFHPESVATDWGIAVIRNFMNLSCLHGGREALAAVPAERLRGPPGRRVPPRKWPPGVVAPGDPTAGLPRGGAGAPGLRLARGRVHLPDLTTPHGAEVLFDALHGSSADAEDVWWLDSASGDRSRFSYMGGRGGPLWRRHVYETNLGGVGPGRLESNDAHGACEVSATTFTLWLRHVLRAHRLDPAEAALVAAEVPFDFWGGLVGYLGYELGAELAPGPGIRGRRDVGAGQPDAALFFADRLVVVDHELGDVFALALHDAGDGARAGAWVKETLARARLATLAIDKESPARGPSAPPVVPNLVAGLADSDTSPPAVSSAGTPDPLAGFIPRATARQYLRDVVTCQEALCAGESYELCLTTQLEREGAPEPRTLYRELRARNPAPHSAFLSFAEPVDVHVCCSSPERFLRLGRGGELEAKPIKGTRGRSADAAMDVCVARELAASTKDVSENLMIVDLLRNDLGRVSVPGSIHVPLLMNVETHATVHQLVSTIRGQLEEGGDVTDCLSAAFPGGSMTGAPKLRSMALLEGIEGAPRGVYSGSIGFLSVNGTADLNIVIRTAVIADGKISVGAGGAVTVASDPRAELEEMLTKAAPVLGAVAATDALPPPFPLPTASPREALI